MQHDSSLDFMAVVYKNIDVGILGHDT